MRDSPTFSSGIRKRIVGIPNLREEHRLSGAKGDEFLRVTVAVIDQVGELTAQDEFAKIQHIYDAGGDVTCLHNLMVFIGSAEYGKPIIQMAIEIE